MRLIRAGPQWAFREVSTIAQRLQRGAAPMVAKLADIVPLPKYLTLLHLSIPIQ